MANETTIPAVFIAPLRLALTSQGFPAETITNDGRINPAGLLAGAYDTIEIRSNVSPPIIIDTRELLKDGGPNPLMNTIKPTIVLSGASGRNLIAPYGVADSGGWIVPLFVAGFLLGVGVLVGRATA